MILAQAPRFAQGAISLEETLADLYRQQLAESGEIGYLQEHAQPRCIENQVRTFHWYRSFLPASGKLLDWGCNHAPDSCLLRAYYGDRYQLYSCDFLAKDTYGAFHDFADTEHTHLQEESRLPYPSNSFDVIIGSGVLEHTATDYESLLELRRILKPDGILIISYLPNWLSLAEWRRRVLWKRDFHRRLYGRLETIQLLKRAGFYPETFRYQTFVWERMAAKIGLGRWEKETSDVLRSLFPVHLFSSTLSVIGRKVMIF